jgi:tetratricopeptide (TPR) repeat protein
MTSSHDLAAALSAVDDLKVRSRRLRDRQRLDRAADAMRDAIKILEDERARRIVSASSGGEPAPQDVRELSVQLADCYGSLGGILRRDGKLQDALEFYRKGKELEQDEAYRINNTYNQLQWLILRILLAPQFDQLTRDELQKVLQTLRRQIATDRQQDPWAYSDVGLLCTLLGDRAGAEAAWDRMDAVNPISGVYSSGLRVFEELAKGLPDNALLKEAMTRFGVKAAAT